MASRGPSPRERAEKLEDAYLGPHATRSTDPRAIRREHPYKPDDFRTEFERDYTRIIHSKPFRRLRHKTQVFISPQNDHLCTRLEHSLHVMSVARTIARALQLNTDLVSAIAVGHDLGHAPFGHEGERCLSKLAQADGLRGFSHEAQSLRVVDELVSPYLRTLGHRGLNLTFGVRDGIVSHCGEAFEQELAPDLEKDASQLNAAGSTGARPATLEGCVVRWADRVAYIGRDLEDAYTVGTLSPEDLPEGVTNVLGTSNRDIIHNLVQDILENSNVSDADREPFIAVGSGVHAAFNELAAFSRERIYNCKEVKAYFGHVRNAMQSLYAEVKELIDGARPRDDGAIFSERLSMPPHDRPNSCLGVLRGFLCGELLDWRAESTPRLALDFVAGMTDTFFLSAFEELFLPRSVV